MAAGPAGSGDSVSSFALEDMLSDAKCSPVRGGSKAPLEAREPATRLAPLVRDSAAGRARELDGSALLVVEAHGSARASTGTELRCRPVDVARLSPYGNQKTARSRMLNMGASSAP